MRCDAMRCFQDDSDQDDEDKVWELVDVEGPSSGTISAWFLGCSKLAMWPAATDSAKINEINFQVLIERCCTVRTATDVEGPSYGLWNAR